MHICSDDLQQFAILWASNIENYLTKLELWLKKEK
jgi:hypothetical protein